MNAATLKGRIYANVFLLVLAAFLLSEAYQMYRESKLEAEQDLSMRLAEIQGSCDATCEERKRELYAVSKHLYYFSEEAIDRRMRLQLEQLEFRRYVAMRRLAVHQERLTNLKRKREPDPEEMARLNARIAEGEVVVLELARDRVALLIHFERELNDLRERQGMHATKSRM